MQVLKHFYYDLGDKIWGKYGFADCFSETHNWYAENDIAAKTTSVAKPDFFIKEFLK